MISLNPLIMIFQQMKIQYLQKENKIESYLLKLVKNNYKLLLQLTMWALYSQGKNLLVYSTKAFQEIEYFSS